VSPTDLVAQVLSELGHLSAPEDLAPEDRELASLRVAVLLEQVFGLTLTDADLGLDLTDPVVLRELLTRMPKTS
jgi:hypothetical protein